MIIGGRIRIFSLTGEGTKKSTRGGDSGGVSAYCALIFHIPDQLYTFNLTEY